MKTTRGQIRDLKHLLKDDSHSQHHLRIEITKNILPHIFEDACGIETKPNLEEVKKYFKDAEMVESIYGTRGVPTGNFHFEDDCYFCEHKEGHLALWKDDLGYAKILSYKEQKFEITKEQILELAKESPLFLQSKLKQWFPEVFKKELEVGKWYKVKSTSYEYLLLYSGKNMSYGFAEGDWGNWSFTKGANQELATEASPQEVETALTREWIKRGGKIGVTVLRTQKMLDAYKTPNASLQVVLKEDNYFYRKEFNSLSVDGRVVFIDGKFAQIIETITIQEAEKLLNKKIV